MEQISAGVLSRAQGCLLGQVAGDALGSLVEFQSSVEIRRSYPNGVRLLASGGIWNTLAGQPTDDSEMALALARSLARRGRYDSDDVRKAYLRWYESEPFDVGTTTNTALSAIAQGRGSASESSQANGALMRISPLGILGHKMSGEQLAESARADARLTHPHVICQEANVIFTATIAYAIRTGAEPREIYEYTRTILDSGETGPAVRQCVLEAEARPPGDYQTQQGWVLIALGNAFHQLLHAPSFEAGVVDTVGRGGDTDTNAAIAGALLGSAKGLAAVPAQWCDKILECRPEAGKPGVHKPRPEEYWPIDVLALAEKLLLGAA